MTTIAEAARALADGSFSVVHDAARRNLIFARSADDSVHAIVAEAVDADSAAWVVACLAHGAAAAADQLEAEAADASAAGLDTPPATAPAATPAIRGQRVSTRTAAKATGRQPRQSR